ncbi:DUF4837 family protein [candidate division KSB1 bacterium]|nr:DUF4837 family protein [candidate division KSB1 bacterium]MBL7092773.1 DUF4837 family protein [candidate division KSB1 bacterium]
MIKKIITNVVFPSLIVFLFLQCTSKKISLGYNDRIYVIADSSLWAETESLLRETFEKPLVTPQHETVFTLYNGNLNFFKNYNNLIFLTSLDEEGDVSDFIQKSLLPGLLERVEQGSYLFTKENEWAYNQYVMFLVSTNKDTLKQKISKNESYLFNLFNDHWTESLKTQMYSISEQTDVEEMLLDKYGWMVKIQYDYVMEVEDSVNNFIMLKRLFPERWFFVHWIDTFDPSVLNKEWCIQKRNELGTKYLNSDLVEEKFVQPVYEEVEFLGKRASKLSGLWENSVTIEGGPFISYSFYDEFSNRIYMMDFACFDPRHKSTKRSLLRQGEVILHTFQTKHEIIERDNGD